MKNSQEAGAARVRTDLLYLNDRLQELMGLTVGELRGEFGRVYGFATHSRNKDYLRKRIAWKIQADADGGLSQGALARIEELAPLAPVRWRPGLGSVELPVAARDQRGKKKAGPAHDRRLPRAGTIITREYQGAEHQVRILDGGFEYQGKEFASLSKVAKEITGTNWNGFLFFRSALIGGRQGDK